MDPVKQGRRVAWQLFGAVMGLYLLVYLSMIFREGLEVAVVLTIPGGLVAAVGGLIAAGVVNSRLPVAARRPFWLTGAICIVLSVLVWGASYGTGIIGLNWW